MVKYANEAGASPCRCDPGSGIRFPYEDRAIRLEWRETGPEGPMDKGTRHIRDFSMRNEADHAPGPTGD